MVYPHDARKSSDTAQEPQDVTHRLWHSVRRRIYKMDRNKMMINFELAALHLSSLLEGKEYPATLPALAEMLDV
jgi:hypothetical protein